MKEVYCCDKMKEEGWYIQVNNNKTILQEEYSPHYVDNAKYCPWCGENLETILQENR
jgi:hypothetical protein